MAMATTTQKESIAARMAPTIRLIGIVSGSISTIGKGALTVQWQNFDYFFS